MSYIPPHKRHLKTPVRRSPVPDSLITEFRRTFDLKKAKEIVFSRDFRAKLFLIGSDDTENKVKLVSFSSDTADYKNGVPLVLLKHNIVKTEINPVGHLLVDVSCLDKNPDMRLMLSTKRKLLALTEKETSNIKEILKSVSVDPNVKGSLGWSFGKALSKDGYCLIGVDRIIATTYENQTLRLIVRDVDRYTDVLVVCRRTKLRGAVFWKCFEMLSKPYGTSCLAMMPSLPNEEENLFSLHFPVFSCM